MAEFDSTWLFPRDFIESAQSGKRSRLLRGKSIWFLQDIGKALSLEQVVKSTAAVFFHRFYLFHSFEQHDRFMVALACLFLAAKVEERAIKLKDLIVVYYKLRMERSPSEKEFEATKKEIILKERILLNTLNFDLTVVHPYEFCQKKVKEFKSNIAEDVKELLAAMYSIINDSYRSPFCLQYPPQHIALAVFYIATIQLSLVPTHPTTRTPLEKSWIDFLEAEIEPTVLRDIALEIIDSYDQQIFFISDRDRILSALYGSHIHTVSNPNTPSFVASNPVVEKHLEDLPIEEEKKPLPEPLPSKAIVVEEEERPIPEPVPPKIFAVPPPVESSVVVPVPVEPVKVFVPPSPFTNRSSLEGSESIVSQATGYSDLDTPRYSTQFGETPSWTPRYDDATPTKTVRERSNSFSDYISTESKRHRFE